MRIHVVYRTHAQSNQKARPDWYDRRTAWRSLQASLQTVPEVTLTVVVDGALPPELSGAFGPEHSQQVVHGGQASSSFRRALAVAMCSAEKEDPETLFWFAEDDYLYRPNAMKELLAAADAVPDADYFALHTPDDAAWHATHFSQPDRVPPSLPHGPVRVGSGSWQRVGKTTSTFGVRARALQEDRWLLDLGSRVGAPFDTATWHALQGYTPFPWRYIFADLAPAWSVRGVVKVVGKPVMRAVLNVVSAAAQRHRLLIAPERELAMHLEQDQVPDGSDWAEVASWVDEVGPGLAD